MPVFTYRGTNRSGGSVSGEVSATSKAELQNLLRRQQMTPTKMSEKGKEFNLPTFGAGVNANGISANHVHIVAFDKENGKVLWQASDDAASYSSPIRPSRL